MKKKIIATLLSAAMATAIGSTQISPQQQSSQISLEEKAKYFGEDMFTYHFNKDGLIVYKLSLPQIANNSKMSNYGDAAVWTGVLLAEESFKYAVTKDEEALNNIREILQGLHNLQEVTGVPGLLARFYGEKTELDWENFVKRETHHGIHKGKGKYGGYMWVGNTSNDQLTGVFFGYTICYDLVEDGEIRSIIREDVKSITNYLVDNNMKVIDVDGKATKHGNMSPRGRDEKLDCLVALTLLKNAHHITGDEKFNQKYWELIKKYDYHKEAVKAKFAPLQMWDSGVNDGLAFLSYYNLLRLEKNPELREYYQKSMDRTWSGWVKGEGNSLFNFIYNAVSTKPDYEENIGAIESLNLMLLEKKHVTVINSNRTDICIKKVLNHNLKFELQSCHPLPMDERPSGPEFKWRGNPRELDSHEAPVKYSGLDFLVAYWLGRYHGFL